MLTSFKVLRLALPHVTLLAIAVLYTIFGGFVFTLFSYDQQAVSINVHTIGNSNITSQTPTTDEASKNALHSLLVVERFLGNS